MTHSPSTRAILRYSMIAATPIMLSYGCSHQATVAKPPAPAAARASATTSSPLGVAKSVAATPTKAHSDSINRANAASFAELRREAARSDSLNRASAAVMTRQSELRETLVAQVHFDLDQSKIRDADRALLDRKATILGANPTVRLRIVGSADDRPDAEYDATLGLRRAEEAQHYLQAHGVDSTRITVSSSGNVHLTCWDKAESCRAENRRVMFFLVDEPNLLKPGTTVAR